MAFANHMGLVNISKAIGVLSITGLGVKITSVICISVAGPALIQLGLDLL